MNENRFLLEREMTSLCHVPMLILLLICSLALASCMGAGQANDEASSDGLSASNSAIAVIDEMPESTAAILEEERTKQKKAKTFLRALSEEAVTTISEREYPPYDGSPSVELNGDTPYFDKRDAIPIGSEYYSKLDLLGRCRTACAIVGVETMPMQQRSSIGDIRPSGWRISKYDWIDGKYLFNRCHLIGYQLTGQNANERNLITGTRYLNVEGMQPYENGMAEYVRRTGNHVLYRVTPVFEGVELVARGVVMEACSLEDDGAGMQFCRWCPNVQPGVVIDYLNGKNRLDEEHPIVFTAQHGSDDAYESEWQSDAEATTVEEQDGDELTLWAPTTSAEQEATEDFDPNAEYDYILNKSSHLIHRPDCPKVADMKSKNKRGFNGTREEVLALAEAEDFRFCRYCNP